MVRSLFQNGSFSSSIGPAQRQYFFWVIRVGFGFVRFQRHCRNKFLRQGRDGQVRTSLRFCPSERCCSLVRHLECLTSRNAALGGVMDSHDFKQRMQRLSDEELTEIVSFGEKDGYLPEAVEAERKEIVGGDLSERD